MSIMRDSTNPSLIPVQTPIVAGYVDGDFAWSAADWARFPDAKKRRIVAVNPQSEGDTFDVERFDLTIASLVLAMHNNIDRTAEDLWPYCDRSNQHTVEDVVWNEFGNNPRIKMWIATLDGTQVVQQYRYPIVAVQYIDTGAYDESVVNDALYGGAGGFAGGEMWILEDTNGQAYITDGVYKRHLDASGLVTWSALGVPTKTKLDPAFIAGIPDAPTSTGTGSKISGTFTGTVD